MKYNLKTSKILIVGLGLIGGSYAEGLSKKGYDVSAIDPCQDSLDYAFKKGIIKTGSTKVEKDFVEQFDLIIFCLYPHVFKQWIKDYGKYIKDGALITDVTGVKRAVIDDIQSALNPTVEFVAHHPMAGRESSGVQNSDSSVFNGANFIVTPTDKNTKDAVDAVKELGFSRISELSPQTHDEMIGFLSQLTHCIAVSLMTCKDPVHLVDYTGDSFRDLTRIAKINENMWPELFCLNKDLLLEQMDLFSDQFNKLKKAIAEDDFETQKEMMKLSTENRSYFDKKRG